MKTIVVTGGTSGIGRALASTYLARGEQVVCVGPDPAKGERFLDEGRASSTLRPRPRSPR